MTDKLKVVAAIREALAAGPREIYTDLLGDRYFTDDYSQATLTKVQDAFVTACNPEAITTVLDALDAALERVKVLEAERDEAKLLLAVSCNDGALREMRADARRLDVLEAAPQRDGWIVAKNVGSFTVHLGKGQHATRATLRAAIDSAATAGKGTTE